MNHDAGGKLDIEGTKLNRPLRGDTHRAKDFRQQFVERLAAACPASQLLAALSQVRVRKPAEFALPVSNGVNLQSRPSQTPLRRQPK